LTIERRFLDRLDRQSLIVNDMNLTLLAVGRLRPQFRAVADLYLERLARYVRVAEIEVREAGRAPTPAEAMRIEAERLRERLPAGGLTVALDRRGAAWSSEQLAARVERWTVGPGRVSLVVGGSHGLHPALVEAADERWSLGPATLPHELARCVACEQLYRAFTILRGQPYHK
jgi:23S rRNA (pseudouridine1915-N3)-methyltransferase